MKVADFGIARAATSQTITVSASRFCPLYFPEQARAVTVMQEAIFIRLVLPCMKW